MPVYKIPESVLVVIHTDELQVLLPSKQQRASQKSGERVTR